MLRSKWQLILAVSILLALQCAPAHATAGAVPTMLLIVPGAVLLFFASIPVKVLAARLIMKTGWGKSLLLALKTSAVSTLIGLPVIAVVLGIFATALRIPVLYEIAFIPIEGELGPEWGPNVALAVLCALSGVVAAWWDRRVADKGATGRPAWDEDGAAYGDPAKAWAWTANAICYGLVIIVLIFVIPMG